MLQWYEDEDVANGQGSVKCIYAFGYEGQMTSWDDAQTFCRERLGTEYNSIRGELLSIHSEKENMAIAEAIRSSDCEGDVNNCRQRRYWIGYRKDCLGCEYQWSDYSVTNFVFWQVSDDAPIGAHECAYFDSQNIWWQGRLRQIQ